MEALFEQIRNYYQNHKPNFQFFKTSQNLFRELSYLTPEEVFPKFVQSFSELKKDTFQSRALDLLDLESWVLSKVNKNSWRDQKKILALHESELISSSFTAFSGT